MKINYTAIIIFLIGSYTATSQKCKPAFSTVDEMTEATVNSWGGKLGGKSTIMDGNGYDIKMYIGKEEAANNAYAVVSITFITPAGDSHNFAKSFTEGDEMLVKTTAGLIKLPIAQIIKEQKRMMSNFYVVFQLVAELDEDAIENLAGNPIEMVRIPTDGGVSIQEKIAKKKGKKMMAQFNCFSKTL